STEFNNSIKFISSLGNEISFQKKEILISPGYNSQFVFFILEGVLKQYYSILDSSKSKSDKIKTEQREFVFRLIQEGEFCESATSLRNIHPSSDSIEDLSSGKAIQIYYPDLEVKMQSDIFLSNTIRRIIEDYYIEQERRILSFLSNSPKQRYDELIANHPEWIGKFPDYVIASFLGITKETMSRFRAKN
ncbi:MAG: Crp/Fnr family transcriptional regulator, partial [Leptospira sp.]|nr:Crp/Fnr family transcriptional regulator [Leptospira sp.]